MFVIRKWSPFIKSYRNRSIISGAIWGSQVSTVRMILGEFKFENKDENGFLTFAKTLFNKDASDNNCLHYCYMIDLPEVRQLLRDNGLFTERSQRLNRRGQLPTKMRHFIKAENSGDETEDDEQYDMQEMALESIGGDDGKMNLMV